MLSIHHLADYAGPYAGSFVPMLSAAAREAEARGHTTTIWLSEIGRSRPWVGSLQAVADVRWLDGATGARASLAPTLRALRGALLADARPAVLHTHFSTYDIPAALMRLVRPRLAVFWHEHGRPDTGGMGAARRAARYARYGGLGQAVAGILCVSPEIRAALARDHAPGRRLIQFANAVDIDRFTPITADRRAAARRTIGAEDSDRVVLHFGWDWHRKGGDLLIGARRALQRPDVLWLTVGAPPDALGEPGGGGRLRALPATDDVRELYAAADVFVSCSRSEGMPYAVLEALASGLPVAGTDLPGQTPLLDGLPGAAVTAADPEAIAQAVDRLLALDDAGRAVHRDQARRRVADSYSLDAWAARLMTLYEQALAGRTGGGG
jgi:glycosyltransferase involved in cell wall biosynthesis